MPSPGGDRVTNLRLVDAAAGRPARASSAPSTSTTGTRSCCRTRRRGAPTSRAGVRTIALPPNLRPALRRHLDEHTMPGADGLLFPNATRTGHLHVAEGRDRIIAERMALLAQPPVPGAQDD